MIPHIANKKLFITGGAGFIGSTLIGRLIDANRITVYDDFRRDALSKKPYAGHANLKVVRGDVLDFPSLRDAMAGHDTVVHCAAVAGIDTVAKRPTETMRVNMLGTANALEAAKGLTGRGRPGSMAHKMTFRVRHGRP
jgi:UDP-glucose 4-epimerase